MQTGSKDIISGSVLLILSVALYVFIPSQVETVVGDTLTPASLPMAITILIGTLSAILTLNGLVAYRSSEKNQSKKIEMRPLFYMGITAILMAVYVSFIPWMGYIVATAFALFCLSLLFGNRNWKQILAVMVIAPPAIMLFFRYTMLVLLPDGTFFN